MKLAGRGIAFLLTGLLVIGLLLFLPAGTLHYPGGWLLIGVLFIPMLLMGAVMLIKAPALLQKRLQNKETQATQKGVVALSGLMFLAGFVVAGLDFRFGWVVLPKAVSVIAAVVFLAGYALYAEVLRENAYLSRTVEVQEGQKVIDTGLYGVVRHPMYAATLLMFLSMPLVLGSVIALVIFLIYPAVIAVRIRNEEQVLSDGLPGYTEYQKRVKYRLVPFIW